MAMPNYGPLKQIVSTPPFTSARTLQSMNTVPTVSKLTAISIQFWEDGTSLPVCMLKNHTVYVSTLLPLQCSQFSFLLPMKGMLFYPALVTEVVEANTNLHVYDFPFLHLQNTN
jgi:hypothetical protein